MSGFLAAPMPWMSVPELLQGRPLVVIAPHPDDETLGCGALVFDAVAAGVATSVICVTDGSRSHPGSASHPPARLAGLRRREMEAATSTLGATLHWLGHPDCAVDETADIGPLIPQGALVLASWEGDPHCDHESVARMAKAALRPDLALAFYPVWGRFGDPQAEGARRLRASPEARAAKARALACHASQMTRLIADDPSGFVMEDWRQAHFLEHPEIIIAAP